MKPSRSYGAALDGPLFTVFAATFPAYKAFMMAVSIGMLVALYALLTRTRVGLLVQASLSRPDMVEALGHDVPRLFMGVFGGGAALAALAGVIGGNAFVTEPGMAAAVGTIVFVVVVVGGLGSLMGAFVASLAIGILQTFAVALDWKIPGFERLTVSQTAPVLPYLLMVLILIARPRGLMGKRES